MEPTKKKYTEVLDQLIKEEGYIQRLNEQGIYVVKQGERDYPSKLLPYKNKPRYLFYKGRLPDNHKPAVAMVGARACSNYGRVMAKTLARDLARRGIQVISGMARGIDTYSGLGALDGGGETYAVLGCGVDICYPTENIELYHAIIKNGGILSEYPPGSRPEAWHFPQRNRIISGLADKVVVVEAKENSGSLITVEWALEQGKDVLAVPGCVGEVLSSGCNRLIQSGAGLVTTAEDIFPEFKYKVFEGGEDSHEKQKLLEKDLAMLYSELSLQPKNLEELLNDTGLKYEELTRLLLRLQLMGRIEQPSENYFSRRDK